MWQSITQRDRQMFMLTFTPIANLESSVILTYFGEYSTQSRGEPPISTLKCPSRPALELNSGPSGAGYKILMLISPAGDRHSNGHPHRHPHPTGPDGCSVTSHGACLHFVGWARCAALLGHVLQAANWLTTPSGKTILLDSISATQRKIITS